MYLRATKTELEATGESAEGMAETTSKLRDSLKALSHGQVDIFDEAKQEYKSTTEVIKEMGAAWSSMSDKEKAAALELMGGKRNANAVSALIENYQEIDKVINTITNDTNSAVEENNKWRDSVEGHLTSLNEAFQELSVNLLDSDVVKFILEIATAATEATDAFVKWAGVIPTLAGALSGAFAVGGPKLTGSLYVPTNTLMVTWNELAA